jgi:hypothetical protein
MSLLANGFPHLHLVRQSLRALHKRFPAHALSPFYESIHPKGIRVRPNEPPEQYAKRVADVIARHMNLHIGCTVLRFDESLRSPGRVHLHGGTTFTVELAGRYRSDPEDIPAVLAHESAHVFLHKHCLRFNDEFENEVLTDVTAAYLGVGWLCLNAYRRTKETSVEFVSWFERRETTTTTEERLGYITPDEFGYVLGKRALTFGDSPRWKFSSWQAMCSFQKGYRRARIEQYQPPYAKANLLRRIGYFRNVSRASKSRSIVHAHGSIDPYRIDIGESLRVTFPCSTCSQGLRVPARRGSIQVSCSNCGTQHECRS